MNKKIDSNGYEYILLVFFVITMIILIGFFSYSLWQNMVITNEIRSKIDPVEPYDKISSVSIGSIDCGWYVVSIKIMNCDNGDFTYCLCKYNENSHELSNYDTKLITFNG